MVILRQKRDNLTEYTTYLMQNDNNTALGPFYDRMQDMLKTMENLLEFVSCKWWVCVCLWGKAGGVFIK